MRLATAADYAAVRAFYNQLIDDMENLPYHPMWDKEGHPSDAYLQSAMAGGELWLAEHAGLVVAALIVNQAANEGYLSVPWKVQAAPGEYTILHAFGVDIRHQGDRNPRLFQGEKDTGGRDVGDAQTDDVTARLGKRPYLTQGRPCVVGVGIGHGLYGDGGAAPDDQVSYLDGATLTARGVRHFRVPFLKNLKTGA